MYSLQSAIFYLNVVIFLIQETNIFMLIHVDTIKQLFNDVPIDNVFLFLKEINLFNKL